MRVNIAEQQEKKLVLETSQRLLKALLITLKNMIRWVFERIWHQNLLFNLIFNMKILVICYALRWILFFKITNFGASDDTRSRNSGSDRIAACEALGGRYSKNLPPILMWKMWRRSNRMRKWTRKLFHTKIEQDLL